MGALFKTCGRGAMRKFFVAVAGVTVVFALAAVGWAATNNKSELLKDESHRLAQMNREYTGGRKAGSQSGSIRVVGRNTLGGRGFNADVWAHDGHAYVGQWGFTDWAAGSKTRFCPSGNRAGVAVVNTTTMQRVGTLRNPAGTSAEDVVVYTGKNGRDYAAVGIQVCGGSRYDMSFFRGLQLFDVTDPANPSQVSRLSTGCCTRGLHELEVEHHANGGIYVYATVPTSRYADEETTSGYRDELGRGDFRMIDVTNPAAPKAVSNWGVQDEPGLVEQIGPGQGCDADPNYGHGAEPSGDGTTVFLAYWDAGFIALDVSDPADPTYLRRAAFEANEDGDAHSSMYDDARGLLFSADEDFCKSSGPGIEKGYGYLRVWDYWNPAGPVQIGEFRGPSAFGTYAVGSGDYTIHNPFLVGTDVYASWYSGGIRVIDASNPRAMREIAHWVPPASQNPVKPSQRGTLSQTPQVWGVYVERMNGVDRIYASDMNSGLWVLERRR